MSRSKFDFFISYTSADEAWAKWIAWILDKEGFSVTLQAWDFAPGSNFVLEMQKAASESSRTIAILSPDYLKSAFAQSEWAAALARDPQGSKRLLVPVRVEECEAPGLLKAMVYVDLVGLDKDEARERLLAGISGKRAKPFEEPRFPGTRIIQTKTPPPFPGAAGSSAGAARVPSRYMPKIRRAPTDLEKRKFIQEAFAAIARHFEEGLKELSAQDSAIECEFKAITATKFVAEIFDHGNSQAQCKIWVWDRMHREGIAYFAGGFVFDNDDNTYNEMLSLTDGELALRPLMDVFGGNTGGLNTEHLAPDEAAEFLWRRFTSGLG